MTERLAARFVSLPIQPEVVGEQGPLDRRDSRGGGDGMGGVVIFAVGS